MSNAAGLTSPPLAGAPAEPACRQCGSGGLHPMGPLPPATVFAGQPLEPPWPGGDLYRCGRCGLGQRHPVRPQAEYDRLYAAAPTGVWASADLRPDQRRVKARIEADRPLGGAVLDVGCYDGRLLAALAPHHARFGVEASDAAAAQARRQGVAIVARRVDELDAVARTFDVVCAVDVIEHLPDPRAFVATLARRVAPGGLLLLSTGALDTPAWRWAGGAYWYCGFPEHLSFVSAAWARRVAAELGLVAEHVERFAYAEPPWPERLARRVRFAGRVLRSRATGAPPRRSVGEPGLFADHLLIALRRPAAAAVS